MRSPDPPRQPQKTFEEFVDRRADRSTLLRRLRSFLARNETDRSRPRGVASSLEQTRWTCGEAVGRRYPAPTTLHNFTRRRNGLNAAYRGLLRQESSFGATTMDACRIHFRVLIAGGRATALFSPPIDTRPARVTADSSPRRLPGRPSRRARQLSARTAEGRR